MLRRRALMLAAGAGALLPRWSRGQGKRPKRIGLSYRFRNEADRRRQAEMMAKHGWREQEDFVFIEAPISAGEYRRASESIAHVLASAPDVLVVSSGAHTAEAYRQSKSVPIVMFVCGYPVEVGVADSLARPGRNVTGNAVYAGTGIWGKLLELLRETRPGVKRIAVLWTYVPPAFPVAEIEPCHRDLRRDAAKLGLTVHIVEAGSEAQGPEALAQIAAAAPDAMLMTSTPMLLWKSWPRIMEFAIERRLPTIADLSPAGNDPRPLPLMHYARSWSELLESAYGYVDRILRGAKPSELPILQPARFELTVNLRSAKAIGLALPQSLLIRADRVIE